MAQQSGNARRALRDLLPATLATGAAGLVVALVVGGTGAAVRSVVGPGRGGAGAPVAELAGDAGVAPGADGPAGVTVRVRPSLPPAIGVVSALDLAPQPPAAVAVGATRSSVEPAVVRGVLLERTPPTTLAASSLGAIAVAVDAAPVVAVPVVAPSTGQPSPDPAKPERRRSLPNATRRTGTVTLASTDRVALTSSDDRDSKAGRTDGGTAKRGDARNGPPDHAPAHGFRSR
jgi:hypothetical protein